MKLDVKAKDDDTKVGVLEVLSGRFQPGHLIKVYDERTDGDRVILYCTGNPGGYAGRAVLTNGNFRAGDRLVVEAVHGNERSRSSRVAKDSR